MPDLPDLSWLIPPIGPERRTPLPPIRLRHLADTDATIVGERLHDWRDNRDDRLPGRSWFRHFGGASLLACPVADERPLGVLLGFASVDRPDEAVIEYVAVEPASRRKGVGRALVAQFEAERREAGARRVTVPVRPDDHAALTFFGALGYSPSEEPGMRRLYGVPAHENWDGLGEDRAVLEHLLG